MRTFGATCRYTVLTLRLDLLWLPSGLWVLFALITWLKRGEPRVFEVAGAFPVFALPLVAGILASSAVLDNPALELHLASPRAAWRVLLEREGLILALIAVAALTFQAYLVLLGVDVSGLGSPLGRQVAWLLPTTVFMGLGCAGAFALKQSTGGALAVGLLWVLQLLGHEWFMQHETTRCLFVFMRAYRPQHPELPVNQATLLCVASALFVSAWALFRRQERYL
jgi:hypothetical protein